MAKIQANDKKSSIFLSFSVSKLLRHDYRPLDHEEDVRRAGKIANGSRILSSIFVNVGRTKIGYGRNDLFFQHIIVPITSSVNKVGLERDNQPIFSLSLSLSSIRSKLEDFRSRSESAAVSRPVSRAFLHFSRIFALTPSCIFNGCNVCLRAE